MERFQMGLIQNWYEWALRLHSNCWNYPIWECYLDSFGSAEGTVPLGNVPLGSRVNGNRTKVNGAKRERI